MNSKATLGCFGILAIIALVVVLSIPVWVTAGLISPYLTTDAGIVGFCAQYTVFLVLWAIITSAGNVVKFSQKKD